MNYILTPFNRNISDKELIKDLINVAKHCKRSTITMQEYNQLGKYSACTIVRRFGSWFNALKKANLYPSRSPINIPLEELFENLESLWKYFGRQPKYHEVCKPLSKFSNSTYENRFGTYHNALKAFIKHVKGKEFNKKEIIKITKNPRSINYRLRFQIMQRDGFKCRICGRSPATDPTVILHIDHIIPCAKGGLATMDNLQTLCSKCNLGKSDIVIKQ